MQGDLFARQEIILMRVMRVRSRTIYVVDVDTVGVVTVDVNIVDDETVIIVRIKWHGIYVIFITAVKI